MTPSAKRPEVVKRFAIEVEEGGDPYVVIEGPLGRIRLSVGSFDVEHNGIQPIEQLAQDALAALFEAEPAN